MSSAASTSLNVASSSGPMGRPLRTGFRGVPVSSVTPPVHSQHTSSNGMPPGCKPNHALTTGKSDAACSAVCAQTQGWLLLALLCAHTPSCTQRSLALATWVWPDRLLCPCNTIRCWPLRTCCNLWNNLHSRQLFVDHPHHLKEVVGQVTCAGHSQQGHGIRFHSATDQVGISGVATVVSNTFRILLSLCDAHAI
jgi:hypothetical protein